MPRSRNAPLVASPRKNVGRISTAWKSLKSIPTQSSDSDFETDSDVELCSKKRLIRKRLKKNKRHLPPLTSQLGSDDGPVLRKKRKKKQSQGAESAEESDNGCPEEGTAHVQDPKLLTYRKAPVHLKPSGPFIANREVLAKKVLAQLAEKRPQDGDEDGDGNESGADIFTSSHRF